MIWVWITSGSITSIFFLIVLFALFIVLGVFCRKKKAGHVDSKLMGVSKKKAKEIQLIIDKNKVWFDSTPFVKMSIKSFDNLKLSARFYPAAVNSNKIIICIHGYCGRYYNDFAQLAPFYHAEGYNLLLVNDRAHGESEGKFIGFSVKDQYDIAYWIATIDKQFNSDCQIFLHGISMGSATSLLVAGMDIPKTVKGIIADCGFISAKEQTKYIIKKFLYLPIFPLFFLFKSFTKMITGNDLEKYDGIKSISHTKIPILFIHGEKDKFVPTWMAKKAYQACSSEKYLEIFPNAGHAASQYCDFDRFKKITTNFLNKYSD